MHIALRSTVVAAISLAVSLPFAAQSATLRLTPRDDLARAVARSRAGDTLVLGNGTWFLEDTLHLGPGASGIRIVAAPGAAPTLSGGRPLKGLAWRPLRNGIWRARVAGPAFSLLWQGDRQLIRARYPNYDPAILPYGGVSAEATAPARVARWADPAGGVIHAMHRADWGDMHIAITGKTAGNQLVLGTPTGNNRMDGPSETKRFVENIFEELDAPGEWYYDAKGGWLYLMPLDGKAPPPELIASRFRDIVDVMGAADAPVRDITISGVRFANTEPAFDRSTESLLRSDWTFHRDGAVVIEHAEGVTVTNGEFTALGGNAVVVSGQTRRVAVRGNEIHAIGASGISFVGRPEAVRSPLFEYHQSQPLDRIDRTPGPKSPDYPMDSSASDNLIHDIGLIEKQSAGVEIDIAARITVSHNSIYRVPRAGINIGDGAFGGHLVSDNDVFDTVRESGDHGAFNAWGRDRYWDPDRQEMDARTTADRSLAELDAVEPIVLRHNRFRCDRGWDIDLDDGASNYVIEDNLLLAGGLKLREGFDRVVQNNIMVNNTFHPHVWFTNSEDVFRHNLVMIPYQPINIRHWGREVDFNVFTSERALKAAQAGGTDAHSVWGDPSFADPGAGDYTVRSASILATGFHSFAMDDFGVTSVRLKARAARPDMPLLLTAEPTAQEPPRVWLGASVKTVRTLGEQSAAGLEKPEGVLILTVDPGSFAAKAGLAVQDVIVAAGPSDAARLDPVAGLGDLMTAYQAVAWRHGIDVEIVRNQSRRRISVRF